VKKLKKLLVLCLAAACSVSLAACSQQSSDAGASAQAPAQTDQQGPASSAAADQDVLYGKVTAVDGSKITMDIGTLNFQGRAWNGGAGSRPQGGSGGSRPEGSRPSGSRPSGSPQGQRANFSNLLTLTGKSTTITVSDASVLKKQEMPSGGGWNRTDSGAPSGGSAPSGGANRQRGEQTSSASLSDVKTGDILKVTTEKSDGKLISVLIMGEPSNS
jgi:hypothetical protein